MWSPNETLKISNSTQVCLFTQKLVRGSDGIKGIIRQPISNFPAVKLAALPALGAPVQPSQPPNPALTHTDWTLLLVHKGDVLWRGRMVAPENQFYWGASLTRACSLLPLMLRCPRGGLSSNSIKSLIAWLLNPKKKELTIWNSNDIGRRRKGRGAGDEKQTARLLHTNPSPSPTSPHHQPKMKQQKDTDPNGGCWRVPLTSTVFLLPSSLSFKQQHPVFTDGSSVGTVGGSCWFSSFYVRHQRKWAPLLSRLASEGADDFYIQLQTVCTHTSTTTTLLFSSASISNCFQAGGLAVGEEKCSYSPVSWLEQKILRGLLHSAGHSQHWQQHGDRTGAVT